MIHFAANILRKPLDPWQQWLVIHLGEMLPDGRPRFRQVLVIVARQNGKTHLCQVLSLFWMFVERQQLVFGTSTTLEQAKKAWSGAVKMAEKCPALADRLDKQHKRIGNGQQDFWTIDDSHYLIGAAERKGGRGDSIDRAIGDELREQRSWEAYNAAYYAMQARPSAQVVYITNMGDARAVVLNQLRREAVDALGTTEERPVGIFEWSALPGAHPTDVHAHAAANPQYGRRMDRSDVVKAGRSVAVPGADPQKLTGFLTEILCMMVDQLDPAVDPAAWLDCKQPAALDLDQRAALAACVDVSPDQQHATLAVAALEGDRVRVEVVHSWSGPDALARCLEELPDWIGRIRPRQVVWFPGGPAATLDAALRDRRKRAGRAAWPPRGVTVLELTAEAPAVCMGFAERVTARALLHSGQDLLDAQSAAAGKVWTGDRWVFARAGGAGHVDAVYAAAGAVHAARTMPRPRKVVRVART